MICGTGNARAILNVFLSAQAIDAFSRSPHHFDVFHLEYGKLFHLESTALFNVLRDDDMKSPLMLHKSSPFFLRKGILFFFAILFRVCPLAGHFAAWESLRDLSAHGNNSCPSYATSWCLNRCAWTSGGRQSFPSLRDLLWASHLTIHLPHITQIHMKITGSIVAPN